MSAIRVLVVDDSALMRKLISKILSSDPEIDVVATAPNGEIGLAKVKRETPDVVTIDIEMPVMNGLELLDAIQKERLPVRPVVISSLTEKGSRMAMRALEAGALEVVHKPSGNVSLDIENISREIVTKVKNIAHIKEKDINLHALPDSTPRAGGNEPLFRDAHPPQQRATVFSAPPTRERTDQEESKELPHRDGKRARFPRGMKPPRLLAIGISTGGPRALRLILPQFSKGFPLPILLVQHIPDDFVLPLVESLSDVCDLPISKAKAGEELEQGHIYIAPGNRQMGVSTRYGKLYASIEDAAPVSGHVPSVDYLFDSVREAVGGQAIACIMTGMGSDGAKAIHRLKKEGAYTIAQNKETSTVFGMPRVAIGLNGASVVLPLTEIIPHIRECLSRL